MSVAWLQPIPCTIFIASSLPNQMAPQPRVTMSRVTCGQCAGVPCPGGDVPRAGDHWQCGARPRHRPMVSVGDQPSWRLHTASTLHTSASASQHQHQPGHDTLPAPCEAQPVLEDNMKCGDSPRLAGGPSCRCCGYCKMSAW